MSYDIDISLPDGTVQRHTLVGKKNMLGRGPEADIIIASNELEPQHILLMPSHKGLWISVSRHTKIPLFIDGVAFHHGTVAWGSSATLGNITLVFGPEYKALKASPSKIHPAIIGLALLALGFVAWTALAPQKPEARPTSPQAPELFHSVLECRTTSDNAHSRAKELAANAAAKFQRSVFYPRDGVEAVLLFQEAVVCFKLAGDGPQAQATEAEQQRIKQKVSEEYVASRLSLETLLEHGDWKKSLEEVSKLRNLLSGQDNYYTSWLEKTERYVQMQISEDGSR